MARLFKAGSCSKLFEHQHGAVVQSRQLFKAVEHQHGAVVQSRQLFKAVEHQHGAVVQSRQLLNAVEHRHGAARTACGMPQRLPMHLPTPANTHILRSLL
eukprot:364940-Chlamydomonas_euryale.AAC.5